jgi:hypothetical protein
VQGKERRSEVKDVITRWKICFYVGPGEEWGVGLADIGRRSFDKLVTATLPERLILKRIKVHPINETVPRTIILSEVIDSLLLWF